jgi:alanyl-tRNA synthetase
MDKFTSEKIRQLFLTFFKQKDHQIVDSHSLVSPDSSVLLTTAGMQPFKLCFLGENCPYSSRVASCQRCFRTSDLEEVGDNSHLTFFEMLGNFSFGDYSSQETIHWAIELLTESYHLSLSKMAFTFFGGDELTPADVKTKKILLEEGIPEERILPSGREDNFWGPVGDSGPCGPTTEIYYQVKEGPSFPQSLEDLEERFVELWNLVFNRYFQDENGKLTNLPAEGIDTGLGLERLTMVLENKASVFETDLLADLLNLLEKKGEKSFSQAPEAYRILADHFRGVVFLIADGIKPSNLGRGYILRRLIRRLIENGEKAGFFEEDWPLAFQWIFEKYLPVYPHLKGKEKIVQSVILKEKERIKKASRKGWKELEKIGRKKLSGEEVFSLYSTYGLSTREIDQAGYLFSLKEFEEAKLNHQEASRQGKEKKFGGHGITDVQKERTKVRLHTATHLLQAALRSVLGPEVEQKGSDIKEEGLRFDFSFPRSLTEEEKKKVEAWVNERIQENLTVKKEEENLREAKEKALFLKNASYPEKVFVYTIFDSSSGEVFSREICGGPHVESLSELGHFRITHEKSSGTGIRRIRAILE